LYQKNIFVVRLAGLLRQTILKSFSLYINYSCILFKTRIYSHSEKYVQITSSKHQNPNNIKYQNFNVQNKPFFRKESFTKETLFPRSVFDKTFLKNFIKVFAKQKVYFEIRIWDLFVI